MRAAATTIDRLARRRRDRRRSDASAGAGAGATALSASAVLATAILCVLAALTPVHAIPSATCFGTSGTSYRYPCRATSSGMFSYGFDPADPAVQVIDKPLFGAGLATQVDDAYTYYSTPGSVWQFYGASYSGFYVSTNGLISFSNGVTAYTGLYMPANPTQGSFIAPYFADLRIGTYGTNVTGRVMARVSNKVTGTPAQIAEVALCNSELQASYLGISDFDGKYCAIITWDQVQLFGRTGQAPLDTIQLVLVSSGVETYAMFHYAPYCCGSNRWETRSSSMITSGFYPTIGFDAGEGAGGRSFYAVPSTAAGTDNIYLRSNTEPVDIPGRFVHYISPNIIEAPPTSNSDDCSLKALNTTAPQQLTPAFNPNILTYSLIVNNSQSFYVHSFKNNTGAKMYVNGLATASGEPKAFTITGATPIQIALTAVGGNSRVYTINANIQLSSEARLATLSIAGFPFAFVSDTMQYAITVQSTNRTLSMTCSTVQPNAVPRGDGFGGAAGGFSAAAVSLTYAPGTSGVTLVWVNVTAQNTVTRRNYLIVVTMQFDNSVALQSQPNGLSLIPAYPITVGNNANFSFTVSSSDASITVIATAAFPYATIDLTSSQGVGSLSRGLALAFGQQQFTLTVISESTSQSQGYKLNIMRPLFTNANITSFYLVTNLGVTVGPFLFNNFASGAPQSGYQKVWTLNPSVTSQTVSVRVVVNLADTAYASADLNGVGISSGVQSSPITLSTDPYSGSTTVLSIAVTAHDQSVVNLYSVSVFKPPVPPQTAAPACTLVSDSLWLAEVKSYRITIPASNEILHVSAYTNITNQPLRLFIRKAALSVISGSTAWDAAGYSAGTGSGSAVTLMFAQPSDNYYLSFAAPVGGSASVYGVNFRICSYNPVALALGNNAGGTVRRNEWAFYATSLSAVQSPSSVNYVMTPTLVIGGQTGQIFRAYAAKGVTITASSQVDQATFFGGVVGATNPFASTQVYGATANAPMTNSRVVFGVFSNPNAADLTNTFTLTCDAPVPVITLANPLSGTTSGGATVTLTGTDFEPVGSGIITAAVTIGGRPCQSVSYDAEGRILCVPPAGEGTLNQFLVTLYSKTSSPYTANYSYSAPQISFLGSTGGPTTGNTTLEITGTDFGFSGTVTVGGKNCPVTSRVPHSVIRCTVPAGEGTALIQVTVAGQINIGSQFSWLYDVPKPQSYSCANAATLGGNNITIFGVNFGTPAASPVITVGGNPCPVLAWNQTALICRLPPGAGEAQAVGMTISGRTNTIILYFAYTAPTLISISPNPVRPFDDKTLVLIGTNFGPATGYTLSINVLGGLCTLLFKNHTHIVCTAPARSAGLPPQPYVIVASQPSNTIAGFGYAAPQITSLSSYVGNTDGSTVIQVFGRYMLGALNDVSVLLGTANCPVSAAPAPTDVAVTITIPAGSGSNLPLTLTVGGLTTAQPLYFNYSAPVIQSVNIQPFADGSSTVVIGGLNFATSGTVLVSNGGTCSPSGWATTSITCAFPAGVGSVTITVTVGVTTSAPFPVKYQKPVITTLVQGSGVTTAGTDTIQITGRNFGPASEPAGTSYVVIRIGTGATVACPRVTWSDTAILCTAPVGNGTDLLLTVFVKGQNATNSELDYRAPTISNAVAPSYPTQGGTVLEITGTSVDTSGTVRMFGPAGPLCRTVDWLNTLNTVHCTLPVGGGTGQNIILYTSGGLSSNAFPIAYDAPSISFVLPSTLSTAGQQVTLVGSNLGGDYTLGSVTVSSVGGNTVTFANHTHVIFTLGSTPGTSTPVIVYSYNGQPSAPATVGVNPPVISFLTPTNGPTGPAYNLTLTGTGFGDGTRLTVVKVGTISVSPLVPPTANKVIISMPPGGFNQQPVSITVGGSGSNNVLFQFDRPTVTGASPATGLSTAGSQSILVTGTSFSTAPVAFIGTSQCGTTTAINDTALLCSSPVSILQNQIVSVQVGSQTSLQVNVLVSYETPVITSATSSGPTDGTGTVLITGRGFGPSNTPSNIKVGGLNCVATSYSFFSISCTLPAGTGQGLFIVVTVNGNPSNSWPFAYTPPAITGITPIGVRPNTVGGTVITIGGTNFGAATGSVSINGTVSCTVLQPSDWTTNQVVCTTPVMAGTVTVTVTTATGTAGTTQTSAATNLQYAAPVIGGATPVVPDHGPTAGGNSILIYGSQFYTSGTVFIGTLPCVISGSGWQQNRIECTAPAAPGGSVRVFVNVYGQQANYQNYNYDAPTVIAVRASIGPTNAGVVPNPQVPVWIIGTNFGSTGAAGLVVTFNSGTANARTCDTIAFNNHTHIQCANTPNGVGAGINVMVALQSASSPPTNSPAPLFSYFLPVIDSITSTACTNTGNTVDSCTTSGQSAALTLTGRFFGPAAPFDAKVFVGSIEVSTFNAVPAGIYVEADLPSLQLVGLPYGIPVTIQVGGQTSQPLMIAFNGPRLLPGTLRLPSSLPSEFGHVTVSSINGTDTILIRGSYLHDTAQFANAVLKYGPAGSLVKPYTCTNMTWNSTDITCQAEMQSVGAGMTFVFFDGEQTSPESVDTISFPPPQFVPSTIKTPSAGSEADAITGSSAQGEDFQFKVRNVGNRLAGLVIYYDLVGGTFADPSKRCNFVAIATPYDAGTGITQLQCRTQPGSGGPYHFRVTAYGANSSISTDTFEYPAAPILYSVRGCATDNFILNSTADCPTSGNIALTLVGAKFATPALVRVGNGDCLVTSQTGSAVIVCTLQPGTGLDQAVTVFSGSFLSQPKFLVSYRQANITAVTGCLTTNPDGSTANCPRNGGIGLTIVGTSFGATGAQVFVGSTPCSQVNHDVTQPNEKLVCVSLPRGVDLNQAVLVLQSAGAISINSGLLSYAACPATTYQANTTDYSCTPCAAGTFSATAGQLLSCAQCPTGQFQGSTGQSFCDVCSSGYFAGSTGSQGCTQCLPATASISLGAVACPACGAGKFAFGNGNFLCSSCPIGTMYNGVNPVSTGVTGCANCTAGFFTNVVGTTDCTPCASGYFAPYSGATICRACVTGRFVTGSGNVDCTDCGLGKYASLAGSGGCTDCDPGTFQNSSAASFCYTCGAGSKSGVHASYCDGCKSGTYQNKPGQGSCLDCPAGSYSGDDAVTCTLCEEGKSQDLEGSFNCNNCSIGYFAANAGQAACTPCAVGKAANGVGRTQCTICDTGKYSLGTNSDFGYLADACVDCPIPQINPNLGAGGCSYCPVGFYQDQAGQSTCKRCAIGTFGAPQAASCTACGMGKYTETDAQAAAGCLDCPAGKYNPPTTPAVGACLSCGLGYWAPAGASACTACLPGTYAETIGAPACKTCPGGQYSNGTAVSACLTCTAGTFSPAVGGATTCSASAKGDFVAASGSSQSSPCLAGTYSNVTGASACTLCEIGKYYPNGQGTACTDCGAGSATNLLGQFGCQACAQGTYQDQTGKVACKPCDPGSAATATGFSNCPQCLAGKFSPAGGSSICTDCAPGTYNTADGLSACSSCPAGSNQPNPQQQTCLLCLAGYFQSGSGAANCPACPVGSYSAVGNQTACAVCGPGAYTGVSPSMGCTDCIPGTYATGSGNSACVNCASGSFSNSSLVATGTCSLCLPGQYQSNAAATTCVACPAGSATLKIGTVTCDQCPAGSYAPLPGATTCLPCPQGFSCPLGAINPVACTPGTAGLATGLDVCPPCSAGSYTNVSAQVECSLCPLGTYGNQNGLTVCTACDIGQIGSSRGLLACDACPAGSFASGTGNTQCTPCGQGKFQSTPGKTLCDPCGTGTYSGAFGAVACIGCGIGTYANGTGATACIACDAGTIAATVNLGACSACPTRSFVSTSGQGACVQCDSGFFANETGLAVCHACPVGTYSVKDGSGNGVSTCSQCQTGRYGNVPGLTACLDCNLGSANNQLGQTACSACAAGYSQSSPGAATCVQCAAGSYSTAPGAIQCSLCAPGMYNPATNVTTCQQCPTGRYFSEFGAVDCVDCAIGYFAPAAGSINCLACDVGRYASSAHQSTCSACVPGKANAQSGQADCALCTAGRYTSSSGQVLCAACPTGTASPINGSTTCPPCNPGYFQGSSGQAQCLPCAIGSSAPAPGQLGCTQCAVGTVTPTAGMPNCLPCGQGKYAPGIGLGTCTDCSAGYFQAQTGQTSCAACNRGSSQPSTGQSFCSDCTPGHSQNGAGQPTCIECPIGSATPFLSQFSCDACAIGTYAGVTGLTACTSCEVGRYAPITQQTACSLCTAGNSSGIVSTFQPLTGQSYCPPCPSGTYQTVPGQPQCESCPIGKFAFGTGSSACADCVVGTASDRPGQSLCTTCFPGTYSDTPGATNCTACPIGRAQSLGGQNDCVDCARGTYAPSTGLSACLACPLGQYSNRTKTVTCDVCTPGKFNSEFTQRLQCQLCPIGTFAPNNGSSSCAFCEPGKAMPTEGASQCDLCAAGKFIGTFGAPECQDCDPSFYSARLGAAACTECPVGRANSRSGQEECPECAAGYNQPAPAQRSCRTCPVGQYTPIGGYSDCLACPAGTFTSNNASIGCTDCPGGTAQNDDGQAVCLDCPAGTFSQARSRTCDKCGASQANPSVGSTSCYACDPNSVANVPRTQCSCNIDYAATFHWDTELKLLRIRCDKCPDGADCSSPGTIWNNMKTLAGWWSPFVGTYYRCLIVTQCVGGVSAPPENWPEQNSQGQTYGPDGTYGPYQPATSDQAASGALGQRVSNGTSTLTPAAANVTLAGADVQCAANRYYVLCSLCKPGYTESIGSECRPCPSTSTLAYIFTGGIILVFLAIIVFTFYVILESGTELMQIALREDEKMARQKLGYVEDFADDFMALRFRHGRIITIKGPPAPKPDFTFKLKIVLGFLQIISNLAINLDIQWPTTFKQFVAFFSPTNLDFVKFASVDCITQGYDYYSRLILFSLAPPILLALVFVVYYLPNTLRYPRTTREGRVQRKRVRRNFWKLVQFALFLVYPSVSSVVLRVYVCTPVGGINYLKADFTIECDTPEWRAAAYVSLIMILAYVVGIPLLFAFALFRYRNRLDESGIRAQFGFLYDAYERKFFVFELVDMAHKLAVTSLIAFLPNRYQLPVCIVVVVSFLIIILLGKPYLRKGDDKLHIFAQIEICLGVIAGNCMNTIGVVSARYDLYMSIALIAICAIFFLYFLAGAVGVALKVFKHTAFAQRFAWIRGDKKKKKAFAKDEFAKIVEEFKLDRNNMRRQPLGAKAETSNDGVAMSRNPLFMAGGTAGQALVDEHDGTVVEVMVNPLLLDKVREAVEEKARVDAALAAEAEKRRLQREAELKKQREDEEAAEKTYQDLLQRAQQANEDEAKALREQAAALKERHDSPMRIDDVFFTAADPLAADSGAIKAEFAPSPNASATAVAAAGGVPAASGAPSAADLLLDPVAPTAAPVPAAVDAPVAAAIDLSSLGSIGTLDGGSAAPASAAAAPADPLAGASIALPDLGTLDLPVLDASPSAAAAPAVTTAAPTRAAKKEKEID